MELVKIKNVSFGYTAQNLILKNISLHVNQGDFLCIVGENGSRKKYIDEMYFRIK